MMLSSMRAQIFGVLGVAHVDLAEATCKAWPWRPARVGMHAIEHVDAARHRFEMSSGVPTPIR
jgi:hypothetical protein